MFKYALQIISRRKFRTFLTSLGVTISVVLLSFIIFGMQGLDNMLTSEFTSRFRPNEMWLSKQGFNFGMMRQEAPEETDERETVIINYEFLDEIEKLDGVKETKGFLLIMNLEILIEGYERKIETPIISGWDTDSSDPLLGTFILGQEDLNDGCVYLSQDIANFYKTDSEEFIGKNIILTPSIGSFFGVQTKNLLDKEYQYEICGVYDPGADRNDLVLTLNDATKLLADLGGFESGEEYIEEIGYQQATVIASDENRAEELKEIIEQKYDITVFTSESLLAFLGDITKALTFALLLFAVVSATVASIGIINTMIMSIYEQTREIGIIKAIGSSNSQVLQIFLIQSGFIGFFGGLLGLIIVSLGMYISNPFLVDILKENGFNVEQFFQFDLVLTLIIIGSSIFVGVLAGIYPSFKAARLDPVKALSYE